MTGGLGDYDLEHPSSCKPGRQDWGGVTALAYTCDVAHRSVKAGSRHHWLYSGTPVTNRGPTRSKGGLQDLDGVRR